ncbi:MAG: NADH-quinone oxidoreductase subunit J [Planctomycetes bacterium]|nr:NADH-quinone oxidoreductase subunit J [Planctomycetota bacterium]
MDEVLFAAFSALAVLAALLAVTRKNTVAAACWLVAMFFGLAGVFVLVEAFFVATTQILVYAGAIMVLFLFVIMLLDLRSVELASHTGPRLRVAGIGLAGVILAALLFAVGDAKASPRVADRVAVALRRPTPPPAAPADDPTGAPRPQPAPAPEAVPLAEVRPEGTAAGDRVYAGAFRLAAADAPRRVQVTLAPEGLVSVAVDGAALPAVPFDGAADARDRRASFPVPGAADVALDVRVHRGGLEAHPGGGPDGSPRAIGRSIFETWILPFEVASVLLTGAIFGAVVLTKRRLS